jgi:hypothetical protein
VAPPGHPDAQPLQAGENEAAPLAEIGVQPRDADHSSNDATNEVSSDDATGFVLSNHATQQPASDVATQVLRPVAALDLPDLKPGTPPTAAPTIEMLPPTDLLVDPAYQRDLSDKSLKLIRRIVEGWDWRRFKPPIVAWSDAGFEVIDGQHTAIAAATHGGIERIPCVVVEAQEVQDRASAFVGHNRDRLAVGALEVHHAMVAAGDPEALTVQQVCARAGVTVLRNPYGSRNYVAGDTMAVGAINALIGRRGALKAREILQALVAAELAPITANDVKAAELLFTDPDYANDLEPLPLGGEHLAAAIKISAGAWQKDAKELAATKCIPLWKAQAGVWFRKCRKRRSA